MELARMELPLEKGPAGMLEPCADRSQTGVQGGAPAGGGGRSRAGDVKKDSGHE